MVIVAVILGIVASIAVRRVGGMSQRSKVAVLQATVRNVSTVIHEYHGVHGVYPADVDASWFTTGRLPPNPYYEGEPAVQVVDLPGVREPAQKTLGEGVRPYWYNRANGAFRARVSQAAGEDVFASANVIGAEVVVGGGSLGLELGG